MSKFNKGYAAILPIIIIVILITLGIGSFIYTHPGFSLYEIYNIGIFGRSTPAPVGVTIDKTDFVKGEILVAFQNGTTYKEAKIIFAKYGILSYQNIVSRMDNDTTVLQSTDIFKLKVPEKQEDEIVTKLKSESSVKSATLNYSGGN